jgi:hypothetical protein
MDLADAALVRVAEREKLRRVFTLDRRDFEVYRPSRLGRFVLLPSPLCANILETPTPREFTVEGGEERTNGNHA